MCFNHLISISFLKWRDFITTLAVNLLMHTFTYRHTQTILNKQNLLLQDFLQRRKLLKIILNTKRETERQRGRERREERELVREKHFS